jgi:hypothetical protein
MAAAKPQAPSLFTFILSLLPIAYFVGFLWYFSDVGGNSIAGIVDIGLGPTVAGIGVIVALMSIGPIITVLRFLLRADWATSKNERAGLTASGASDPASDFDADAAIARYMAGRGNTDAQPASLASPAAPTGGNDAPPTRPSFGRKLS